MATRLSQNRDHRGRFIALIVLLAVVLAGAIATTAVMATRDRPAPWADLTPTGDDPIKRAVQIADHVEGLYRDDAGAPLARITAGEDVSGDLIASAQMVSVAADSKGAPYSYEAQNVLFFRICGPAEDCGLRPTDDPSRELTLAARAAHELALRGLHDISQASAVMVIMPPGFLEISGPVAQRPDTVLYFRRDDLDDEMDHRLRRTVPAPVTPEQMTSADVTASMTTLSDDLYTLRTFPASDGTGVVYQLTPPPEG